MSYISTASLIGGQSGVLLMLLLYSVIMIPTIAFIPTTNLLFLTNNNNNNEALVSSSYSVKLHMAKDIPSWSDIEHMFGSAYGEERPLSIDSVLDSSTPSFSTERPTLFRERHGWCPYSERVWLTLELLGIPYDTIKIDNTGGPRPSYYGGQTPQLKWPNGRTQGESMDLVHALIEEYSSTNTDILMETSDDVQHCINQFRNIFPKARPSSRAAFLFQWNGDPLWKSTFEQTLEDTNELLSSSEGPFFCGSQLSSADIAWAPFLERYRYQLPCLHGKTNLNPYDSKRYPHLTAWYDAMDTTVPAYACRVKGDASSWRKVLTMAGFGNAGLPPQVQGNMEEIQVWEASTAKETIHVDLWNTYASTRPYVAETPSAEAALIMTQNKDAILRDTLKNGSGLLGSSSESELDEIMRAMIYILIHQDGEEAKDAKNVHGVGEFATFLDERMCVPRDMGSMSAASIKYLAYEMSRSD
mmetsp:Transcript_122/g.188  ORF Transcript_122/g.188 Transcript_122/m.188 type:complete len:471 (+) Transcript_122:73-1485(+)|eukprot:CAMPEP_0195297306 /NCGR_PEP_ID=MMETSP0707-20130614/21248_1 /TAXON_ID=33640 /ORGANISM="Asterionellopsis glacialis, Strain CCMP134" /LENGTH=470 /DNA_ID=CAMNT_0040359087 /DNA_START=55 /DNA_END=1467 /DNA_ORIENTATION=+